MRDKFSELIEQGVAKFNYTNIAKPVPETDPISRMYNNIWSIPSDTHMYFNEKTGERYITGSMVGKSDKWSMFVYANSWGAMNFKTTGYWSLCDFLQKNGLCGNVSTLNGDTIYLVTPIPAPEVGCPCPDCPGSCVTTESKMPMNIAMLTYDGNVLKVRECFKDKLDLYGVAQALNESIYVKGNDWTVNGDKLMCPIGNKVYVL